MEHDAARDRYDIPRYERAFTLLAAAAIWLWVAFCVAVGVCVGVLVLGRGMGHRASDARIAGSGRGTWLVSR